MSSRTTTLKLIECNIDDMNPEIFPYVFNRLFESGARDVWLTPIIMKQCRAAQCLSVLCSPEELDELCSIVFAETTTLGLRVSEVQRIELARSIVEIETDYGPVRMKVALDGERVINAAPEFSDCQARASDRKVALKEVYRAAAAAWEKHRLQWKPPGR